MHEVPSGKAGHIGVFRTKPRKDIGIGQLVQRLQPGELEESNESKEGGSSREVEGEGRKPAPSADVEGKSLEEEMVTREQPQTTPEADTPVAVVSGPLGSPESNFQQPVRLLWEADPKTRARSLHSTESSRLSGDRAVEHSSGLQAVLALEGATPAMELVPGQIAHCRYCGKAGVVKKPFVLMNSPYGKNLGAWLNRLALHDNGIALTFARTETRAFRDFVWPFATALLFIHGRVTFFQPDGNPSPAGHNSGGPSVMIAYGNLAKRRLIGRNITGKEPVGSIVLPI